MDAQAINIYPEYVLLDCQIRKPGRDLGDSIYFESVSLLHVEHWDICSICMLLFIEIHCYNARVWIHDSQRIRHLLKNNEYYDDPLFPRKKIPTMNKVMVPKEVSLEQFLEIIAKADILIKAPDPDIYNLSKAVSWMFFISTMRQIQDGYF